MCGKRPLLTIKYLKVQSILSVTPQSANMNSCCYSFRLQVLPREKKKNIQISLRCNVVMAISLENLFKEIIDSETKAQERKSLIWKLRSELESLSKELIEAKQEHAYNNRQISIKTQQLINASVRLRCLTSRKDILEQQLKEEQNRNKTIREKKIQLQREREQRREEFSGRVLSFCGEYDPLGHGATRREQRARQQLAELEQQVADLEKEMSEWQSHKAEQELESERARLTEKHAKTAKLLMEYEEELRHEKEKVVELEQEKARVDSLPKTDPQFLELQNELEQLLRCQNKEEYFALKRQQEEAERAEWQEDLRRKWQQQQRLRHKEQSKQVPKCRMTDAEPWTLSTNADSQNLSASTPNSQTDIQSSEKLDIQSSDVSGNDNTANQVESGSAAGDQTRTYYSFVRASSLLKKSNK